MSTAEPAFRSGPAAGTSFPAIASAVLARPVSALLVTLGDPPASSAPQRWWPEQMSLSVLSGTMTGMIGVLWAYEGWQYATFSAGEKVAFATLNGYTPQEFRPHCAPATRSTHAGSNASARRIHFPGGGLWTVSIATGPHPPGGGTTLLATLALLLVTACWGSTFFLIKDLLDRVPTLDFLAVRFAIASAAMLLVAPRAVARLSPAVRRHAIVLGLLYGVAQILQTAGLAHTPASISGFVTGLYVVFTPLLAAAILHTRITAMTWGAVALATAGLAPPSGWPRPRLEA